MKRVYKKRVTDDYFRTRLGSAGALLIEGPKWCGKTTTGEELSSSTLYMQDPDKQESLMYYATSKPSVLLEGETPRLIDEWQMAPNLWNAVRFTIDRRRERGQFILTGSSVPELDDEDLSKMHTGTGRITRVRMHTMSLFESGYSDGTISLRDLFDGKDDFYAISELDLEKLAEALCKGGWPANLDMELQDALNVPKDYLEGIVNSDISRTDGVKRDPDTARQLIRSLSRNICTLSSTENIVKDMKSVACRKTVSDYINALRNIFLVEDIPAWSPVLMSKARVRTSVKRNITDPSIAAAALNAGPNRLVSETESFGPLFESLCVRDLRVYSMPLGGKVYHYHDNTGLEVDMIIELEDGRWGAIEVKLASGEEDAASNLNRLVNKISSEYNPPSFKMILMGVGYFRKRTDGIIVVPVGCLRD